MGIILVRFSTSIYLLEHIYENISLLWRSYSYSSSCLLLIWWDVCRFLFSYTFLFYCYNDNCMATRGMSILQFKICFRINTPPIHSRRLIHWWLTILYRKHKTRLLLQIMVFCPGEDQQKSIIILCSKHMNLIIECSIITIFCTMFLWNKNFQNYMK